MNCVKHFSLQCKNWFGVKMEQSSTRKYTQLSRRIFVSEEWPVRGIEVFLLKLAKTVIDDVTSDKLIVLQVQNIPTVLVRYDDDENHEAWYYFERITNLNLSDSYVIINDQSENRTAYYFLSPDKYVLTLGPGKETDCGAQQNAACRAQRWTTSCDVVFVLAVIILAILRPSREF